MAVMLKFLFLFRLQTVALVENIGKHIYLSDCVDEINLKCTQTRNGRVADIQSACVSHIFFS